MGNKYGVMKIAAKRIGLSFDEYTERLSSGQKWCHKCKTWRTRDNFCVDKTRGDGLHAVCRGCNYPRRVNRPSKAERASKSANGLAWCRVCEDWLTITNVRHGICKPHIREQDRKRYKTDPIYKIKRQQHARSRRRNILPMTPEAIEYRNEWFSGECAYCPKPATTFDHLIPVSRGGDTTPDNIVPACVSCNSSKKAEFVLRWMQKNGHPDKTEKLETILWLLHEQDVDEYHEYINEPL